MSAASGFDGKRLKAIRQAAGVSRDELAQATGLGHRTIGFYETGSRDPRAVGLFLIAQALGCRIDDMFAWPADRKLFTQVGDEADQ